MTISDAANDPLGHEATAAPVQMHELGLSEAARALREGEVSAENLARQLLERARAHADLNAFITIDEESVLASARQADRALRAGGWSPLLGVPMGVKDSYLTNDLDTSFGIATLAGFRPAQDAPAVTGIKDAGAIVFGKNNLVEMSFGLTGHNAHHGQVRNPYDRSRVSGGSSSGSAAAVAARLVPAALGGDTVGSIRVPAALCGVVGYKPTPGRWPSAGVAPIAHTLDTTGLLARSVQDAELVDALLTRTALPQRHAERHLRGMRLAYAPRQHLAGIDGEVEDAFRDALRKLRDAGAQLVEVDLGEDFLALGARATWPVFLHEAQPALRAFLAANGVPASFEQIHEALGEPLRQRWSHAVVPDGPASITQSAYRIALQDRDELRRRLASLAFGAADALLFPTTPCAAPRIEEQWSFEVAGSAATDLVLARHTAPGSAAGLPGVSLPMGLDRAGLPLGLEVDAPAGGDRALLSLARRVEAVLGGVPAPGRF